MEEARQPRNVRMRGRKASLMMMMMTMRWGFTCGVLCTVKSEKGGSNWQNLGLLLILSAKQIDKRLIAKTKSGQNQDAH